MQTQTLRPEMPARVSREANSRGGADPRLAVGNITVLIVLALTASLVHELGHWFWGTVVDGVPTGLTLLSARPVDPTVIGSTMATAAGPLASLVACYAGLAVMWLRPRWGVLGAGLVFMHAFVRLGPYAVGALFDPTLMRATDEGIVSLNLGLPVWSFALVLTGLFLVAFVLGWRALGGTLRQRLGLTAVLFVLGAAGATTVIALEPVLFGSG
jgi:hypothetical protein